MMIFLSVLLIACDRVFKMLAEKFLADGIMPEIEGVVRLHLAHNTGASFSLFAGNTLLLTVVTGIVLAALAVVLLAKKLPLTKCSRLGAMLMLSGGIGNWIDRAFFGCVTDYIEVTFVRFAIFNFADILVCVGAALVCIGLFISERKAAK